MRFSTLCVTNPVLTLFAVLVVWVKTGFVTQMLLKRMRLYFHQDNIIQLISVHRSLLSFLSWKVSVTVSVMKSFCHEKFLSWKVSVKVSWKVSWKVSAKVSTKLSKLKIKSNLKSFVVLSTFAAFCLQTELFDDTRHQKQIDSGVLWQDVCQQGW